jgi:hypothetical protein
MRLTDKDAAHLQGRDPGGAGCRRLGLAVPAGHDRIGGCRTRPGARMAETSALSRTVISPAISAPSIPGTVPRSRRSSTSSRIMNRFGKRSSATVRISRAHPVFSKSGLVDDQIVKIPALVTIATGPDFRINSCDCLLKVAGARHFFIPAEMDERVFIVIPVAVARVGHGFKTDSALEIGERFSVMSSFPVHLAPLCYCPGVFGIEGDGVIKVCQRFLIVL